MQEYFGNDGLTFAYSIKSDKEPEKIMLEMSSDGNFTNTIDKYSKQGICQYEAMPKLADFMYQNKNRTILELAVEAARLLGSFFGYS